MSKPRNKPPLSTQAIYKKKILCLPKISSRESLRIDENIQIKNQLKTPNIKSIKGIVSAK